MNDFLLTQLFLALTVWLPLCAVALAPLALGLTAIRRTAPRIGAALLAGYLLLAAVTGFYAYALVPADYTRYHRLARTPAASPLNEQHQVALQYADAATLTAEQRANIRARVAAERATFRDEWLTLTAYGFIAPALLFMVWAMRRRHNVQDGATAI